MEPSQSKPRLFRLQLSTLLLLVVIIALLLQVFRQAIELQRYKAEQQAVIAEAARQRVQVVLDQLRSQMARQSSELKSTASDPKSTPK